MWTRTLSHNARKASATSLFSTGVAAFMVMAAFAVLAVPSPHALAVAAQVPVADIGAEAAATGAYVESQSVDELGPALADLHRAGAVFVEVATPQDAQTLAADVLASLPGSTSCDTVLVLTRSGIGAQSTVRTDGQIQSALAASVGSFGAGDVEAGIVAFADAVGQGPTSCLAEGSGSRSADDGSGNSIWIVGAAVVVVGGAGWGGYLWWKRRQDAQADDAKRAGVQAEVEQLLAINADRVIELADAVTLTDDPELIALYEEASLTYRQVSAALDSPASMKALNELKVRMETADQQLTTLEQQLDPR